ncbi:MAG: acetyl-CoA carboxylase biotin carboxyl carrier protein [Bacteroidota bacterium]|nr:acetyl-CoA carboxylase biotin carboxyl carrier protein [Bacteroidota bacterium]
MDIQYIKKLIKVVHESGIQEIEIEEGGSRIRITRDAFDKIPSVSPQPAVAQPAAPATPVAPVAAPVATAETPQREEKRHVIRSPIVGTFYRAPAPDAEPFIRVGQYIERGTVICIIEAMKIMNEIESDQAGRVVGILVENGQPVEFNQPLVVLEPS